MLPPRTSTACMQRLLSTWLHPKWTGLNIFLPKWVVALDRSVLIAILKGPGSIKYWSGWFCEGPSSHIFRIKKCFQAFRTYNVSVPVSVRGKAFVIPGMNVWNLYITFSSFIAVIFFRERRKKSLKKKHSKFLTLVGTLNRFFNKQLS